MSYYGIKNNYPRLSKNGKAICAKREKKKIENWINLDTPTKRKPKKVLLVVTAMCWNTFGYSYPHLWRFWGLVGCGSIANESVYPVNPDSFCPNVSVLKLNLKLLLNTRLVPTKLYGWTADIIIDQKYHS